MGRRAIATLVVGAVVGGLVVAAGCSLVTSYDGFTPDGPACGKRIPSRPPAAASQKSGPELIGFTTAMQFLDDADAGAAVLGYDLDNLCTCPDHAAHSCVNPNASADQDCDVANTGIDNAAGIVLGALFPAAANARLQDSLRHATNGLLVRVRDWDGTANDASVSVSIWNTGSLKGDTDGGAGAKLDGTDEILVDFDSLLNAADLGSKYNATTAFVSGGLLVAPLDVDIRFEIPPPNPLAGAIASIPLRSATLVGKIAAKGPAGLVLTNAQLVGRVPMVEVFKQIANIGICQNTPAFAGLKKPACAAFDLPLKQPGGSGRSNAPCDALSFAVGLTVGPAKLGGSAMVRQATSACGAEPPVTCP